MLVWGSVQAGIAGSGTKYTLLVKRTSTTKQEIEEFGNNSGVTVKTGLSGKLGTGATRLGTEESLENNLTMTKSTTILES